MFYVFSRVFLAEQRGAKTAFLALPKIWKKKGFLCFSCGKIGGVPPPPPRFFVRHWAKCSVYIGFVKSLKTIANIMAAHNNTTPDWDMLPFIEARAFVRKVGLKSKREWNEWAKTKRPTNIPSDPWYYYSSEFIGYFDWLGFEGKTRGRLKVADRPETYVLDGTTFKAVPGMKRRYYVSQDARVLTLSVTSLKPRLLTPHCQKSTKRWNINLRDNDGQQTQTCLHRLVAKTWIPLPQRVVEKGLTFDDRNITVDHVDGNAQNNNASNLRWITRSENIKAFFKSKKGLAYRKKQGITQGRSVKVRCLDNDNVVLYHAIDAFRRDWPSAKWIKRTDFPRTLERDGRKYVAELVEQPDLEGEVWKTVPADLAKSLMNGANCSRIKVSSMGRKKDAYGVVQSLMGKPYARIGVKSCN